MVEELQECEVLWPDHDHDNKCESNTIFVTLDAISYSKPSSSTDQKTRNKKEYCSRPMEIIQQQGGGCSCPHAVYHHELGNKDNDDDDDDERLPPHVLVARRFTDRMAYSVCTGNGRTLKGRDLRHLRNSVLRMTGFLER